MSVSACGPALDQSVSLEGSDKKREKLSSSVRAVRKGIDSESQPSN